tara:strand:+ start:908 stop:2656 length:1749 start_codon:yes stop_codon:yes gene_type:complete
MTQTPKEIIHYSKRLYKNYVRKYLGRLLAALLFSLVVAGTTSSIAWLLDPAVKKIFIENNKTYAVLIPMLIVIVFAAKGFSLYMGRLLVIVVGHRVVQELQNQMAEHILLSDTQSLESKHSGKYISQFLYDVGQIQSLISTGVLNMMKDPLTLIALVSLMFYQNWKLALFAVLMIPLAAFFAKSLGKRMGKVTTQAAQSMGEFSKLLLETIRGSKIIKIYRREKIEEERSRAAIQDVTQKQIKIGKVLIRATPIMEALTGIMIAGFIYFSGFLISSGEIGINNFFSFLTAMMLSYQPTRSLATLNMTFYQGAAAAKRIFAMIDEKIQIKDQEKLPNLKIESGNIKFENVSFQYKAGKESAVKNINLNIQGEKITALVGHSGAGKSTIMNLIPRFYQQQEGRVIIDSQDINNISLYSLRDKISMVSQDTVLFDDTVENNIKFAKIDATKEELVEACKLAVADDFISELPEKYQTIIGENGVRLSGGQKQRLSIARAILKNAPIILLDEATSSLDTESEEKVQNAIFNLTKNKTTLVIAHRLSTIKKSDNIIVMRDGNVVGSGKHDELMKNSEDYKNLYSKQVI